jgi:hypothetical protein
MSSTKGLLPVIGQVCDQRGVRVQAPYAAKNQWGYPNLRKL